MSELDRKQVASAVAALNKHVGNEAAAKEDGDLWAQDVKYYAQIVYKRTPVKKSNPFVLPVPHTLYTDDTDVCLITKDPHGKWESAVEDADIDCVKRSISVQHLKKNFTTFDSRRTLADSYDIFMADSAILPMLPKLLGSKFFNKKKQPIAVEFKKCEAGAIQHAVERARLTTSVIFNGGVNSSVYVAHPQMDEAEMVDNILAACDGVASKLQYKWGQIKAIYLKTRDSVALPVYTTIDMSVPEETTDAAVTKKVAKAVAEAESPAVKAKSPKQLRSTRTRSVKDAVPGPAVDTPKRKARASKK